MSTYTQIIYHIVFATFKRKNTLINSNHRRKIFKYIWGILKNKNCHLYRINGVSNHIHIITSLHPTINLASLVKNIKRATSEYIKTEGIFPDFEGWQEGYGGFTYAYKDKNMLIEYVKNQEFHHKNKTYEEELIALLKEHGIEFDENYLF